MQKGKKHACVKTHLEIFLLNSKWWKNRWDHLPSVQVVLSTCTILSGTQSNGKFLPQKSTAFRHHVWQPICGLHLIKPGLRMAAENATSMFLKMVQGAIHMGPCVWSSFYSWKPPYYYSHAPISFSMLPLKLTMKTFKCWIQVTPIACSWWNSVASGRESRNIHAFSLKCGTVLSPQWERC